MAPPPAWFTAALATAPEERETTCEGTSIAYRAWGDPADRNIVLVHGGAAHSRWWRAASAATGGALRDPGVERRELGGGERRKSALRHG